MPLTKQDLKDVRSVISEVINNSDLVTKNDLRQGLAPIENRLTNVEDRLSNFEGTLSNVEDRLSKVETITWSTFHSLMEHRVQTEKGFDLLQKYSNEAFKKISQLM